MVKGNVYIIIATYNGMPWINKCLKSCGAYNVVVVDNASADDTVSHIKQHFSEVDLFENKTNLGFGQANNKGISFALKQGADFVFLLNQDAYLVEDCLERLLQLAVQNPHYGILSPIHLNGDSSQLDRNFAYYLSLNLNNNFYSDFVLRKKIKDIYKVSFVNAAAWLISKSCLETVGGFDPLFFHYGEDDNYCQRLKYYHFKVGVATNCFVQHDRNFIQLNSKPKFSKAYYEEVEKKYKYRYANINEEQIDREIEKEYKRLKKACLKSFLLFKNRSYKHNKTLLRMLKGLTPHIKKSYLQNKTKGFHYLNS